MHLVAGAAYWGEEEAHGRELTVLLRRLAEAPHGRSGQTVFLELVRYPALLALYAAGIAMVARENYSGLSTSLSLEVRTDNERGPILQALSPRSVVDDRVAQELRGAGKGGRTPLSDELHGALRESFSEIIPSDEEYTDLFDRFEYVLSLAEADWWLTSGESARFSGGRFAWRRGPWSSEWLPVVVAVEVKRDGHAWLPLAAGMFGGDTARLQASKAAVDEWARSKAWG